MCSPVLPGTENVAQGRKRPLETGSEVIGASPQAKRIAVGSPLSPQAKRIAQVVRVVRVSCLLCVKYVL